MKKAYKSLYMEAIKEMEAIREIADEQDRVLDETINRLKGIASNNVMLRDKVNRYRVISFMLGVGLLAQYCLFRFY